MSQLTDDASRRAYTCRLRRLIRKSEVRFRVFALLVLAMVTAAACAQDASTGAVRGTVSDPTSARVPGADVILVQVATGIEHKTTTSGEGVFSFQLLPPGEYALKVTSEGMAPLEEKGLRVEVGGLLEVALGLQLGRTQETITVTATPPEVDTQPIGISSVLDERAVTELPLNGRRFSDLTLLAPGVTQDPRSLTSATNGDLSFGGLRGFHTSFLVDGVDNNNAFFAQARGRYRAPYQFSNEVIHQFRVSSNTYGAELGRSGGAVINVVTRSGSNQWHGSLFEFYRDGTLGARYPSLSFKPPNHQNQFGFTLGGPIKRNRIFIFGGFDQHIFHVPIVVRFANGSSVVVPQPADYEASDQAQVFAAATSLSQMAGTYPSALLGNAGFLKLDFVLTPRHQLSARLSTSRYWGQNNVFFDPASPVTYNAVTENGEEMVSTESAVVSLTSSLSNRVTSHARLQFSRDLQVSSANTADALTNIYGLISGFGRSNILPRRTREHRLQLAETINIEGGRHEWKFGGDIHQTWIYNFFPSQFGGEYIFDNIHVNPFTFAPQRYGLEITPLRAYAHQVPRYYMQNFGQADSHPDTREYAAFAQDTIRMSDHFGLTLGARYDLQTFNSSNLVQNPLWPGTGTLPLDINNIAPRAGFSWTLGHEKPVVVRGGFGIFYTRIPQIYTSAIETDNGLRQTHLFLDNTDFYDRLLFPAYPSPLVSCAPMATVCTVPHGLEGHVTSDVSTFSPSFQAPYVAQGSLNVEREIGRDIAVGASYLYVHGEHLIRARDLNLPPPVIVSYPVFDDTGTKFLDQYYSVASFADWQFTKTLTCPYPPCVNPLERPVAGLGAINTFESSASSIYHGITASVRRRMASGLYFRMAYTWAQARDDTQDALVVGRPATVQNSYAPQAERGRSVTDQRHRVVASWVYEIDRFERPVLRRLLNDWKLSGVVTVGSGRPVNARIVGDANRDENSSNDRLPGVAKNSYTGPGYSTTDLRISRFVRLKERLQLELMAESFNTLNRNNKSMTITDDGFLNSAGHFILGDKTIAASHFPGYYTKNSGFLAPTSSYAPRQVQLAAKLRF